MAKVTITITDSPMGDKIKMVIDPSFGQLMQKLTSGAKLTCAEGLGIFVANKVMAEQKTKEPTKIIIPRLRGR